MKRYFELWLDESGDFNNDIEKKKKGWNPSLIGGVLVEKDVFSKAAIEKIIPEKITSKNFSHGTAESPQLTFEKFTKIEEKIRESQKFSRYVVFSNAECIMVLDNNLTYQNIMAEGIMQLIEWLKARFKEVQINILIANRVEDTASNNGKTVEKQAYEIKLREKMIMSGLHRYVEEGEWRLELASARKDKRLMIADNICNCFLTRKTKFKGEQSAYICSVYENDEKTKKFSALQSSMESQFNKLMLESRLGEAITVICQCEDTLLISRCMDSVRQQLKAMSGEEIELQYDFIAMLMKYYISIVRNYGQCEKVINNILKYFVPILENAGESGRELTKKMAFDLNFFLFTALTHTGNISGAFLLEEKCDKAFRLLPTGWDAIGLGVKYDIRKIMNHINAFDFEKAMILNKDVIKTCEDIKDLLCIYHEETKYDELAKALGTQVQIYTFLLRFKKEFYESAVKVSERAINEFVQHANKCRQYIYRTQLEIEAGEYDRAYKYLCLSNDLEENAQVNEFKERFMEAADLYKVYAYVKLMAEGKAGGWKKADELYDALQKTRVIKDLLEKTRGIHPREVILWKYAMYLIENDEWKAGFEAYKNAIELCTDENSLTIYVIGLAVELERYAMALKNQMKERKQYKKSLQKKYQNLNSKEIPDSIRDIFGNIDFKKENWDYYYELSRRITQ